MADSTLDSQLQSAKSCLRHISSSLFNIPGFFVGFSSKNLVDSRSLRSPTSPLDISFFSSFSNPFSHKSPTSSSSQFSHRRKWEISKVGLGLINLLADETKPFGDDFDLLQRKNVIFGPQVKDYGTARSKSLPKNFTMSRSRSTKTPNSSLDQSDASINLGSLGRTTVASVPLLIAGGSKIGNSLDVKSSSLPMPIESGNGNVGSLSAHEIKLSEDYTCIISHGPNPKTTHIFGDCVLECETNDLPDFEGTENLEIELPQEVNHQEVLATYSSTEFLSFYIRSEKMLDEGDEDYLHHYAGDEALCSFDCCSVEEDVEDNYDDFCQRSPDSSYSEDHFLMGNPVVT